MKHKDPCTKEDCPYARNGQCHYWADDNFAIAPIDFPEYCDAEELS
jgi:hypothetical protein